MTLKGRFSKIQRKSIGMLLQIIPDKWAVQLLYYASLGRFPNLRNPKRFTEKIQWYKLNYRTPLMTQCADKYRMREYVESYGYGDHLPKLYQVCNSFDDICFQSLPNSFVLKSNNGSGTNIFIQNKSNMDMKSVLNEVEKWKVVNTIGNGREWAYKNIVQKLVLEELLVANDILQKNSLIDYKMLCFHGKVRCVWADVDRLVNHVRNFYDRDWKLLDVESNYPNCASEIPKPFGFEKMLEIAECFAKDFPFVRVDFYSVNHKVFIGELTFYPWSGCVQFEPDSFDYELGSFFALPDVIKT